MLVPIIGVKSEFHIKEIATFDIYIAGNTRGRTIIGHTIIQANVIDNLAPRLLLGTEFLADHGATIYYYTGTIKLRSMYSMKIPVVFSSKKIRISRRVVAIYDTTIPPHIEAFIRAR